MTRTRQFTPYVREGCGGRFGGMSILSLLYWVILVLSCIGVFAPPTWTYGPRISGMAWVALFIILGLRVFRMPIQ